MAGQGLKAVFFDLKDTLGYVDRPGHLVTYKPSTLELLQSASSTLGLRIGVITNLPRDFPPTPAERCSRTPASSSSSTPRA